MKKVFCLLTVFMLCVSLVMPVLATESEDTFVPSITYKPEPEIVPVEDEDGEEHIGVITDESGEIVSYVDDGCLDVTPIAYVWDEDVFVPQEVETLLLFVYEELFEGEMELPYDKLDANIVPSDMVIRDLFDARWYCAECENRVAPEGVVFDIIFDLGIMPDVDISAMTYDEETDEWEPVIKVVNNGDGTVTCTFEHLCAIAFSMPMPTASAPVDDFQQVSVWPWVIVLLAALIAVIIILILKNKKVEE